MSLPSTILHVGPSLASALLPPSVPGASDKGVWWEQVGEQVGHAVSQGKGVGGAGLGLSPVGTGCEPHTVCALGWS